MIPTLISNPYSEWARTDEGIAGRLFRSADIETDGFISSLIHVKSITEFYLVDGVIDIKRSFSVYDYEEIKELLAEDCTWIFHHGHGFDKPELERLLGVPMRGDLLDSLAFSWYLYPERVRHGLESWGDDFGVPKPPVCDWVNISRTEVTHRCESDVKIQTHLIKKVFKDALKLYGNQVDMFRCLQHLSWKLEVAALQSKARWKLDVDGANKLLDVFNDEIDIAEAALFKGMPRVPVKAKKTRPKVCFKVNGDLSSHGQKWFDLCAKEGLDPGDLEDDHVITVVTGYKDPNVGSPVQIKNWITDLGWIPETFEYKKDDEGNQRKIPQIKLKDTGELCPSIQSMVAATPALQHLSTVGVTKHRRAMLIGWLKNVDKFGFLKAQVQGLTNTLRFKHKELVNIPSIRKPWGKELRGLLTVRDVNKTELCGSDMESLEDRTKQHYMWKYDPDYVRDMMAPDFDPHLDMAAEAKLVTPAEITYHKGFDKKDPDLTPTQWEEFKRVDQIRHGGKSTNYSATYGAGPETISRAAKVPIKVAEALHRAYWDRNWSLKAIAENCKVKQCNGKKWLWNPVAKLWYFLKTDKDRFSTLNQGTGTYAFDRWVWYILERRRFITGQFHDEVIIELPLGNREAFEKVLKEAIQSVNDELQLNRDLGCSVDYGFTYADIH